MAKKKLSDYLKNKDKEPTVNADSIGEEAHREEDKDTPFLPTLFEQLDTPSSSSDVRPVVESSEEKITLEAEDIEIIIELPFDAAAQITKWPGWTLSDKEKRALSRLWIKPFRIWLEDVDNLPLYLAAITTLSIAGEKFLGYKVEQQERAKSSITDNRTGDAGTGKN